jgi:hypothetical protein
MNTMTPALTIALAFFATGLGLFTLVIIVTDLRLFIRREANTIHRLFGRADAIHPPAPAMRVRPSTRSKYATAPLSECIWQEK